MPQTDDGHTKLFYVRVDAVVEVILKNMRYLESKRHAELTKIIAKQFKCSGRTAQRLIKEAIKEIKRIGTEKKEAAFITVIRDLEYAKHKTKEKEIKVFLEAVKYYAKMFSLEINKVEHSGGINLKGFDLGKLTEEELAIVEGMVKRGEDPRPYLTSKGLFIGNS